MVIPKNQEPEVYPVVLEIGRPIASPACRLGMKMGHFRLSALFLCDRLIQDRTALHFLDVLAKVADRQLLGDRDCALVGSFLADHHPEEGCLARPIGTDQSDFFAGIQLKRSIHEEQLLAILLIDV